MEKASYYIFFEDDEFGGYYLGKYQNLIEAITYAEYLWKLFDFRSLPEKNAELSSILSGYKHYSLNNDVDLPRSLAWERTTGSISTTIYKSSNSKFPEEYMKFKGDVQTSLLE